MGDLGVKYNPHSTNYESSFDQNHDEFLDKTEITTMVQQESRANISLFTTAVQQGQSPQEVVAVYSSLDDKTKEKLINSPLSLPWDMEEFIPLLWRYNPAECDRVVSITHSLPAEQLPDEAIISIINNMDDALFDFGSDNPQNRVVTPYENTADALENVLDLDPQIVAFGETHNSPDNPATSTSTRFVNEILPMMKNKGFNDLVLEFLPSDIPEDEMSYFMETGSLDEKHTEVLLISLLLLNDGGEDTLNILNKCRDLKIQVHGGGPSMVQTADFMMGLSSPNDIFPMIRDNSKHNIQKLAQSGKKVMSYGGSYHNNTDGNPENASFAPDLMQTYNYVEVDLISPSVLINNLRLNSNNRTSILELKTYSETIPEIGKVNFVDRSPFSYALVYPL